MRCIIEDRDSKVESALLKRAVGYDYTETRIEESDKGTKTTTVEKHLPPDTKAAVFWLKSRKPETWDKSQQAVTQEDEGLISAMDQLSTEELARLAYGDD